MEPGSVRHRGIVVGAALLAPLFGLLRLAPSLNAPFLPKTAPSAVSTDPAHLPYYAVRSLLRMRAERGQARAAGPRDRFGTRCCLRC